MIPDHRATVEEYWQTRMRADSPGQTVINLAGYARNGYTVSQFRVRVIEMTSVITSHAPWLIAGNPINRGLIIRTHPVPRTTEEADADIALAPPAIHAFGLPVSSRSCRYSLVGLFLLLKCP